MAEARPKKIWSPFLAGDECPKKDWVTWVTSLFKEIDLSIGDQDH
jgi:hypothetical protein